MTFAIYPPVTMKDERVEGFLRSNPATMVKMGKKRPPALDIEESMKQRIPASTIYRP